MRTYKGHCPLSTRHPAIPPHVSNEVLCQIEFARNYKTKNNKKRTQGGGRRKVDEIDFKKQAEEGGQGQGQGQRQWHNCCGGTKNKLK